MNKYRSGIKIILSIISPANDDPTALQTNLNVLSFSFVVIFLIPSNTRSSTQEPKTNATKDASKIPNEPKLDPPFKKSKPKPATRPLLTTPS